MDEANRLDELNNRVTEEDNRLLEGNKREQSRKQKQKAEFAADVLPIIAGIKGVEEALNTGKCDQAQKYYDETRLRVRLAKPAYYNDGKEIKRDLLRDGLISYQCDVPPFSVAI